MRREHPITSCNVNIETLTSATGYPSRSLTAEISISAMATFPSTPNPIAICIHKVPASCGLTATPLCCACADKRPHLSAYPLYVDGVGYVDQGTRWDRYCWTCKGVIVPRLLLWESRNNSRNITDSCRVLERKSCQC